MTTLPRHIAIVMDGNGRWATERKLPRVAGHRAGAKTVREIVEHAAKLGIEVLSLFAFSLENRGRPGGEVKYLMSLFLDSLEKNAKELNSNNVRLRIVGDRSYFSDKLKRKVLEVEALTATNTGLTLAIAIHYSGRWDITQAAQQLAQAAVTQALDVNAITVEKLGEKMCLADLPEPDLLIRTSGEQRLSNFMLWQFAYSEIYFCTEYWPDFNKDALDRALQFFSGRQRRFGLTPQQVDVENA